jgi:hypothetical protein
LCVIMLLYSCSGQFKVSVMGKEQNQKKETKKKPAKTDKEKKAAKAEKKQKNK